MRWRVQTGLGFVALAAALWGVPIANAQPIELMTVSETEIVRPADPEQAIAFGFSVAADGDLAVIGATGDTTNGHNAGAAYVFQFDGSTWIEETKLLASDGGPKFANAVALSGSTAIIGARSSNSAGLGVGAAYIFRHDGSQWVEVAKLIPSDADQTPFAFFGTSVAIEGNTAIVGAPGSTNDFGTILGSVYIFRFDGKQWVEEAKLAASDEMQDDGFGASVAISGDTCFVGAPGADSLGGNNDGATYVFQFDGADWVEQFPRFVPFSRFGRFGSAVAFDGRTAVVGATGLTHNGRAHVYQFGGHEWTRVDVLEPRGIPQGEHAQFGTAVDVSGKLVLVGSTGGGGAHNVFTGNGYLFEEVNGEWILRNRLAKEVLDPSDDDYFSSAIAIGGESLLVGAYQNQDTAGTAGAVFAYDIDDLPCQQDFDNDGTLDIFDVFAFLKAWSAQDPSADWFRDGEFTLGDVFWYIDRYAEGCL